MEVVNIDNDDEAFKVMMKEKFFKGISDMGIDLKEVPLEKKTCGDNFIRFNYFVEKFIDKENVGVFDMAVYLFEDYFDSYRDILKCFDDDHRQMLEIEARIKTNRAVPTSSLRDAFV